MRAAFQFARQSEDATALYRDMVLTRVFDAKAVALQRTGRFGTYASSHGQEAVGAAIGCAMRPDDFFLPPFLEPAAMFVRGVRMSEFLLYWGDDERGSDFAGPREDFPICVPVDAVAPYAAGVPLAIGVPRWNGERRLTGDRRTDPAQHARGPCGGRRTARRCLAPPPTPSPTSAFAAR
jgi:pyruvate dehydrogenase E1 component alpha subunit